MVELTLRCTNALGLTDPSPVDEVWEVLSESPTFTPEEGDDEVAVGGYKSNPIADRVTYDLIQSPYTALTPPSGVTWSGTTTDYRRRSRLLRSVRLFIVRVQYNGGEWGRLGEDGLWWATDVDGWLLTPIEVRRTGTQATTERVSGVGEIVRWSVSLEECLPVVGA